MALKPWYKVITPREDLREGRPIDASEFAVHLEQVRDGRAPSVYQNPADFLERTYLTKNLAGLVVEVTLCRFDDGGIDLDRIDFEIGIDKAQQSGQRGAAQAQNQCPAGFARTQRARRDHHREIVKLKIKVVLLVHAGLHRGRLAEANATIAIGLKDPDIFKLALEPGNLETQRAVS